MPKTLILIPSRMSATRLPGKPLLKINNLSIILHVCERAKKANIGDVVVATQDREILEEVEKNGGKAVLTSDQHKTGTDRIFECFQKLKINDMDYIINLQGDEPAINHEDIINLNNFMIYNNSDIGTLASEVKDNTMFSNENVVKVLTKEKLNSSNFPIALNFTRKGLSKNNKNIYHHIGMYAYKVDILEKVVNLHRTKNEIENRLEQLRALDNGIKINVALAKSSPIGVDTKEDYLAIKKIMEYKF
jgi:3-deoxy-manno-octulosonate cytidylyltransferase (CMP-KDO synthetase)